MTITIPTLFLWPSSLRLHRQALPPRGRRDLQRVAGAAAPGAPALQRAAEPRAAWGATGDGNVFPGKNGGFLMKSLRKMEVFGWNP